MSVTSIVRLVVACGMASCAVSALGVFRRVPEYLDLVAESMNDAGSRTGNAVGIVDVFFASRMNWGSRQA